MEAHFCALDPGRLPMNMSEMAHRVTDAIKRMTDRLTHRKNTEPQQSSKSDNISGTRHRSWPDDEMS